ncbi:MAG: glycosyltransferase family 2 protein, partial [Candidatus Helarchaeota archaeon]
YYPRRGEPSKLSSFGDGWRHLRFMLLYRPTKFLLFPGIFTLLLSLITFGLFVVRTTGDNNFAFHSLILGAMFLVMSVQFILTGFNLKAYSLITGYSDNGFMKKVLDYHSLERELLIGLLFFLFGIFLGGKIIYVWASTGFGGLSQIGTAVISFTCISIGLQLFFSSIFLSLFLLRNKE